MRVFVKGGGETGRGQEEEQKGLANILSTSYTRMKICKHDVLSSISPCYTQVCVCVCVRAYMHACAQGAYTYMCVCTCVCASIQLILMGWGQG